MYKINIIEKESQIYKGNARKAMHVDCRWELEWWTSIGGGNDNGSWSSRYCLYYWYCWYSDGWRCGRYCWYGGAALGKLVCTIGLADGTDLNALDGDTVGMAVGAALDVLDGDTMCVEVQKSKK